MGVKNVFDIKNVSGNNLGVSIQQIPWKRFDAIYFVCLPMKCISA